MIRPILAAALLAMPLLLRADVLAEPLAPHGAIHADPIPLNLDAPWRRRVGGLVYEAGWVLRGEDPWVGGVSAMTVAGSRFTLLSDEGRLITFRMTPQGPVDALVRRLPGPGALPDKRHRDSESLGIDPVTGRAWIGMEWDNLILRYDRGFRHVERVVRPAAMRRWPVAGGAETLVRLRDGRVLVIAEEAPGIAPETRVGLLFAGDPTEPGPPPLRFDYLPPAGFVPTDAAELPDGRIIVLNRHFAWADGFAAAVTTFPAQAMRAHALIRPRELAQLRRPLVVDNMEAIAVTREGAATIVWIASDDNMTLLQRTLLLRFRLAG